MKFDFKGKKVTVMGIGLHGGSIAMIKWLLSQGAFVTATDKKNKDDLNDSIGKLEGLKNLKLFLGQHRMEDFERADMVIKNPMVRWDDKYIKAALAKKIPVEMDSSLFFKLCPSKKIIGITGTKGKTTTSLAIFNILKQAGKKVIKVGIGQEAVMDKLSEIDKDTVVVFELSSWRLSALGRAKISPHVAVLTNIYPDHLNYYEDMHEYQADKKYIFEFQGLKDYLVINWDNQNESDNPVINSKISPQVVYYSMQKTDENKVVYVEQDRINFNFDGRVGSICDIKDIKLRGAHNISNILAACAVGIVMQINPETISTAVRNFKGAEHRLELVDKINGIDFYNDTTATTPQAAIAAINSLSGSIYLIAGGSSKKLDLGPLVKKIGTDKNIKKIFLLKGEASEVILDSLKKTDNYNKVEGIYDGLDMAVQSALALALADDSKIRSVLLSPGCASFGMFQNEFDRGKKFKQAVAGIK